MRDGRRFLPTRRGARSAVAAGVAFALCAQFGLAAGVEWFQPVWADPEYGERAARLRQVRKNAADREQVLVIGTSRSALGFATDLPPVTSLPGGPGPVAFNLSLNGCGPLMQNILLKRALRSGPPPDYVVVEIMPVVLAHEHLTTRAPNWGHDFRLRWADLREVERHSPDVARPRARKALARDLAPWYTYRLPLQSHFAPDLVDPARAADEARTRRTLTPTGWYPLFPEFAPVHKRPDYVWRMRAMYEPLCKFTRIDPLADRVYRDLLDACREHRVTVAALVWMPESSEFRDFYGPGARECVRTFAAGLARDYGVPFVDASEWMPDAAFSDGHHMYHEAAAAFTDRFWRQVFRPQWERDRLAAR